MATTPTPTPAPVRVVTPDVLAAPRTRDETLKELEKLTQQANSLLTIRQNLQQRLEAIARPTERERELAQQLVELNSRIRGTEQQAITEQEALEGQGRGITLQSIAGQQEQIRKQASRITRDLALQRLAASEELQVLTGLRQQDLQALLQREESATRLFDDITGLSSAIQQRTEREKEQARNTLASILEATKGARFTDLDQKSQQAITQLAQEVGIPAGVVERAMDVNYRASLPQPTRELRTVGGTLYEVVQRSDGRTEVRPLVSAPATQEGPSLQELKFATELAQQQQAQQLEIQKAREKASKALSLTIEALRHPGLSTRVGPNPLARLFGGLSGKDAEFESTINSLISTLTLDNLSLMKGVLSDADIAVLQQAASKLAAYRDRNFAVRERAVIKELDTIKERLLGKLSELGVDPNTALQTGVMREDDLLEVESILQKTRSKTTPAFDPSIFF